MTHHPTRRAEARDLPEILQMVHALAAHHGDIATATLAHLERDLLGQNQWSIAIVAPASEGLKGYAVLCPLLQLQFGQRGMDMHHLFVKTPYRRQGVGNALIKGAIAEAKGSGCVGLSVGTHPDNHAAAEIYRAAGFRDRPPPGPRFSMRF